MWLNVGCGTHRAPAPWHNIDTVRHVGAGIPALDVVNPDQIVDPDLPLPFPDASCDRIMCSHVLEHVPWEHLPDFLLDVRRVSDGEVLFLGPDIYRAINAYKQGTEPWSIVATVLEHKDWPDDMAAWPGAPHHWNCHEARVMAALARTGWNAQPILDDADLADWPVVAWNPRWQFAVIARSNQRRTLR